MKHLLAVFFLIAAALCCDTGRCEQADFGEIESNYYEEEGMVDLFYYTDIEESV